MHICTVKLTPSEHFYNQKNVCGGGFAYRQIQIRYKFAAALSPRILPFGLQTAPSNSEVLTTLVSTL